MTLRTASLAAAIAQGANLTTTLAGATAQLSQFQRAPWFAISWTTTLAAHVALMAFFVTLFLKIGREP